MSFILVKINECRDLQLINKQRMIIWFGVCAMLSTTMAVASSAISLSPNMQAVLLSKILLHERHYRRQQDIRVFVLSEPRIAMAFNKLIGSNTEHIRIVEVAAGDSLPSDKYDVIYFNHTEYLQDVIAYGKQHGVVTATGNPKLVEKGVTLGTGTEKGRPRFYLNLRASFATDLEWEQKVLNIVKVYR